MVVSLLELAKMKLENYHKILIWLKKVECYKAQYQEQFWSCKFTSNYNLKKIYKLKKMESKNKNFTNMKDLFQ